MYSRPVDLSSSYLTCTAQGKLLFLPSAVDSVDRPEGCPYLASTRNLNDCVEYVGRVLPCSTPAREKGTCSVDPLTDYLGITTSTFESGSRTTLPATLSGDHAKDVFTLASMSSPALIASIL